jgi:hypothetical protein
MIDQLPFPAKLGKLTDRGVAYPRDLDSFIRHTDISGPVPHNFHVSDLPDITQGKRG